MLMRLFHRVASRRHSKSLMKELELAGGGFLEILR